MIRSTGLVGTILAGRYEILDLIGTGAMGQVYKAKHVLMKRLVAVKMMNANMVSGAAALKRFQKEAELASALNHPNILTVHDFGLTDEGAPYLVMAYLQGQSFDLVLEKERHLDPSRVVHIFRQLCAGLGHAHEKGVIHRDVKPSNIYLVELDGDPDFVKIVDFGIAKMLQPLEGESEHLTRTGEVFGSPPYMSPEQCRARPVDGRSDIYSLGCVMYRALTGVNPILGYDLMEFLYKHVNEMPQSFSMVCPELNIPADFEALVFRALAKEPEERFQTMQELKNALDSLSCAPLMGLASTTMVPALKLEEIKEAIVETAHGAGESGLAAGEKEQSISGAESKLESGQPTAVVGGDAIAGSVLGTGEETTPSALAQVSSTSAASVPTSETTVSPSLSVSVSVTVPPSPGHASDLALTGNSIAIANLSPRGRKVFTLGLTSIACFVLVLAVWLVFFANSGANSIEMHQKKAQNFYNQAQYPKAEEEARLAILEEGKAKLPRSSKSRYLLGLVQYADGDYEASQESLESAYKIIDQNKNADVLERANIESALGRTYAALGLFAKAEPLLRSSYKLRKSSPDDPADEADSLAALADLFMRQKKYKNALNELTSALRIIQVAKGQNAPETATALNNLGQAYQLAGNLSTAEELYKRGLSIRDKTLGKTNPLLADSYECLAAVYSQRGKITEAKDCLMKAVAIEQKSLDPSSPRLANTRARLQELEERLRGR
jgi:serine/threonine protein kinase/uncharacterized protein HemY